ncbi:hypothetical protein T484DRAFT_1854289, partial [Baffinella frigidus]
MLLPSKNCPVNALHGEDFVTLFDFANSPDVELYNRSFRLITCNAFTEQFFEVNNMRLVFESQ